MTFKTIFYAIISIVVIGYSIFFIMQGVENYWAIDYKRTFNEYHRVVYQQGFVMSRYRENLRHRNKKTIWEPNLIRKFVDEKTRTEDSLLNVINQFPDRYEEFRTTAQRLHEEVVKVRNCFKNQFANVSNEDSVEVKLMYMINNIGDEFYDCKIIPREEKEHLIMLFQNKLK